MHKDVTKIYKNIHKCTKMYKNTQRCYKNTDVQKFVLKGQLSNGVCYYSNHTIFKAEAFF